MAFKKCKIIFFNIILLATLGFIMHTAYFVCHLKFFCSWVDGKGQNKNDFSKSGIDLGAKLI